MVTGNSCLDVYNVQMVVIAVEKLFPHHNSIEVGLQRWNIWSFPSHTAALDKKMVVRVRWDSFFGGTSHFTLSMKSKQKDKTSLHYSFTLQHWQTSQLLWLDQRRQRNRAASKVSDRASYFSPSILTDKETRKWYLMSWKDNTGTDHRWRVPLSRSRKNKRLHPS